MCCNLSSYPQSLVWLFHALECEKSPICMQRGSDWGPTRQLPSSFISMGKIGGLLILSHLAATWQELSHPQLGGGKSVSNSKVLWYLPVGRINGLKEYVPKLISLLQVIAPATSYRSGFMKSCNGNQIQHVLGKVTYA